MQEILFDYKLNPTTWAYLSSLLMIGMYFKFHRFWSVRNLDLVALIAISPGLLLIYYGMAKHVPWQVQGGYVWLFGISGFFFIRLLIDPIMIRRPLLEPNLSLSGLTFTGISLLVFLISNIVTANIEKIPPPERLETYVVKQGGPAQPSPGLNFFYQFAGFSSKAMIPVDSTQPEAFRQQEIRVASARSTAILGHLAVVIGMVLVGYRHFDNIHTGVAAATLYLLTFYTSQMTGQVDHVVPAALLVWAVVAYRRPMIAGVFMGIAVGVIYYPWFLLPLWCGFYWRKGVVRFLIGVGLALAIMITWLALSTGSWETFWPQLRLMLGFRNPLEVGVLGLLDIPRKSLPLSGTGGLRGPVLQPGFVAAAKESGHAVELFGGRDAGHPILARQQRRIVHRLVPAASDPDDLPSQLGRPRGPHRRPRHPLALAAKSGGEIPTRTVNNMIFLITKNTKLA